MTDFLCAGSASVVEACLTGSALTHSDVGYIKILSAAIQLQLPT